MFEASSQDGSEPPRVLHRDPEDGGVLDLWILGIEGRPSGKSCQIPPIYTLAHQNINSISRLQFEFMRRYLQHALVDMITYDRDHPFTCDVTRHQHMNICVRWKVRVLQDAPPPPNPNPCQHMPVSSSTK